LPEVIDRFNREVKEVNKNLGEHEQIKRFRLVTEEWTPTTGELSPTLKLKRNYLTKEYKELIAEIYFNAEKDPNFLNRIKIGINGVLKNLPKF
jgi:long-chain acyl-CoA synthetase